MSQDLEKFGMPEEELFAPVDHSDLESEKITAPRYSYWQLSIFVIHTMRQQSKNGLLYSPAVSFNNNSNVPACPMVPKWDPYHSVPEVTGVCQAMQVQLHG